MSICLNEKGLNHQSVKSSPGTLFFLPLLRKQILFRFCYKVSAKTFQFIYLFYELVYSSVMRF